MTQSPIETLFDKPLMLIAPLKKHLGIFSRGDIEDDGKYIKIKHFPYKWFSRTVVRLYGSKRIEKMYELVGLSLFGKSTIRIHKFFIPELVYVLITSGTPRAAAIADDIIDNTWVKDVFVDNNSIKDDTDMSRIDAEMNVKLFDWQKEFIELFDKKRRRNHLRGELLSFGCGLGKTITAMGVMTAVGCDGVVVIAPKSTLVDVWEYHIKTFYKKAKRIFLVGRDEPKDADFFVFNYESMEKIESVMKFIKKKKRLGIIVDESQNFLRIKSLRTQNLISLMDDTKCERCLLLSGTPVKGSGSECIPLLKILDPMLDDEAQEIFVKAFGISTTIGADILHARLNMVMHRKTMDEVYTLPAKEEIPLPISIPNGADYTVPQVKKKLEKFVKERTDYHMKNMPKYKREWADAMEFFSKDRAIGPSSDFARYLRHIEYLKKHGYTRFDPKCVQENIWCGQYEKDVLIPALPKPLREGFLDCRSKIKYLDLCVSGEVLGYLDNLRSEMIVDIMKHLDIMDIVDNSLKKVIFATTYVPVVDYLREKCDKLDLNPVCVYGKTSSKVTDILDKFRTDPKCKVLIATMQTLATGVTLTEANTVVFCNNPWRESDKIQMSHRVHRIGQDTECRIITVSLDTGSSPNLSDRTQEILNWSKEMAEAIVDGKMLEATESYSTNDIDEALTLIGFLPRK